MLASLTKWPHKKNPATLIVIKADREVDHGRVVAIMDAARGYGLTKLAIATEVNEADRTGVSR